MPKSSERISHFESISNENLINYMKGSPISLVTGRPIKFGSHEHKHQISAIRKIIQKRKLEEHKSDGIVASGDSACFSIKKPAKKVTFQRDLAGEVSQRRSKTAAQISDPMAASIAKSLEYAPPKSYPPIPAESLISDGSSLKSAESDAIPSHLIHSFLPSGNKSFY